MIHCEIEISSSICGPSSKGGIVGGKNPFTSPFLSIRNLEKLKGTYCVNPVKGSCRLEFYLKNLNTGWVSAPLT